MKRKKRNKSAGVLKQNLKSHISVCLITKDEEENIERCLRSVKGIADEIIVVDTGSTDQTVDIARRYTDKVYFHPWEGSFSKARNQALTYATCDWIFIIDADEELVKEDIPRLREALQDSTIDAVMVEIFSKLKSGKARASTASRGSSEITVRSITKEECTKDSSGSKTQRYSPSGFSITATTSTLSLPGKIRTDRVPLTERPRRRPRQSDYLSLPRLFVPYARDVRREPCGKQEGHRACRGAGGFEPHLSLESLQRGGVLLQIEAPRGGGGDLSFLIEPVPGPRGFSFYPEPRLLRPKTVGEGNLLRPRVPEALRTPTEVAGEVRQSRDEHIEGEMEYRHPRRHGLRRAGRPKKAQVIFQEAMNCAPEPFLVARAAGIFYYNKGLLPEARHYLLKAGKLNGSDPTVHQILNEIARKVEYRGKEPTISCCMIVKDEEAFLEQCLESVKDYVDEIIIVDTGSTDQTVDIARRYTDKVYFHPWEGSFSKARNQALAHATCDWIFIIDADEELLQGSGEKLRQAVREAGDAEAIHVNTISVYSGGRKTARHNSERLFRNNGVIHYEGIVHNRVVGMRSVKASRIELMHYGYNVDEKRPMKSS